jgi:transcriptional regulator GlxA family with amidase domain
MRISILALEGLFDTALTVMLDAFTLANKFSAGQMGGSPYFDVSIIGMRKRVRSGQGLTIPVRGVTADLKPDWVVVPALSTGTPEQLVPALERPDVIQAKAQLLKWRAEGALIAASCIGTFLVAETGLLDHREATTTWWLGPLFRQRYPNVLLDESRMLVPTDVGVTAGAAMGHLDLALWLIRRASPELAALVSRYLLADIRSSQAPYIIPNHLAQADPLIQRFELWSRDFRCRKPPMHWRRVHVRCSGVARRCLANRRLPTFRTYALNARNRFYTAVAWTLMPSQPKWVTSTEQLYARSCVNAWGGECGISGLTCAEALT